MEKIHVKLNLSVNDITNLSWEEIISKANAHKISEKCIGQEKQITIGDETYDVVLIGVNHDNLVSGGKANTTWQLKNCYNTKYKMNSTATNAGSWDKCLMRTQTMPLLLDLIQNDVKVAIKEVRKPTAKEYNDGTIVYSNDKLFLLSVDEVYGKDTIDFYKELFTKLQGDREVELAYNEGIQYSYWKSLTNVIEPINNYLQEKYSTTDLSQIDILQLLQDEEFISLFEFVFSVYRKVAQENPTSYAPYWLRSPNVSDSDCFCGVRFNGTAYDDDAISSIAVSFAFCI